MAIVLYFTAIEANAQTEALNLSCRYTKDPENVVTVNISSGSSTGMIRYAKGMYPFSVTVLAQAETIELVEPRKYGAWWSHAIDRVSGNTTKRLMSPIRNEIYDTGKCQKMDIPVNRLF
jgi:hypothetical protein